MKAATIEEALELTGYGKYTMALTFMCGLSLFAINSEVYSIGYILPAAECDLNLDTASKSMLTAIGLIGAIVTSNFWGFLSDTRGRKFTIILSLFAAFICSVASSFSTSLTLYTCFRFLNGVFLAAPSGTIFAYLGEFLSKRHRSRAIICASLFAGVALTYIAVLSKLILESTLSLNLLGFEYNMWRIFTVLCALPSLAAAFGLLIFPESPKFLLCRGEQMKALAVLKTIYKVNTNSSRRTFPVLNLIPDGNAYENGDANLFAVIKQQTAPLFQRPHRLYTVTVCVLQFGNYFISSGLLLWYPDILNQISKSNKNVGITVCEAIIASQKNHTGVVDTSCRPQVDHEVFLQNLIIGMTYFFGYMAISAIINVVKKKYLIMTFHAVGCLSGLVLYFVTNPTAIDVVFIALLILPGVCVPLVNAVTVDLFPTHLRGMAVGVCMMLGRLGSVVSSSITGFFLEANCYATFFTYAGSLLFCSCLALVIPRNAKY